MPTSSTEEHRRTAPQQLAFAVLTMSDTRTKADDKSGALIVQSMLEAGHVLVSHQVVRDEPNEIIGAVGRLCAHKPLDAIITTGGTGIAPRDQTPEAIRPLLDVEIPGFGEMFRMLSWEEIGPATMLSRAFAGRIGSVLIFCLPGSTAAARLAMQQLIVPELPHLVHHSR